MASKLREALLKVSSSLCPACRRRTCKRCGRAVAEFMPAVRKCLTTPPLNCEVGTPDEQSERFDAHCRKYMGCKACPLRDADGSVPKHCEFRWAQTPYEKGGDK